VSCNSNFNAANDPVFQQQVTMALIVYASTVATEPTTTTNHEGRLALLTNIFGNLTDYAYKFALICAANGVVPPTATDAQVLSIVTAAWADLSGSATSLI